MSILNPAIQHIHCIYSSRAIKENHLSFGKNGMLVVDSTYRNPYNALPSVHLSMHLKPFHKDIFNILNLSKLTRLSTPSVDFDPKHRYYFI